MEPNTPGPGGYVLAVAVSVLAMTTTGGGVALVALLLAGPGWDGDLGSVLVVWAYVTVVGMVVAVPFACVGVPAVHLLCRRQPSQRIHVVVTGAVTFVLVVAFFYVGNGLSFGGDPEPPMIAASLTAAATMAGRASVIPLVRRRRERVQRLDRSNSPIAVE